VDIGLPENAAHRYSAYFRHRFTTDKTHTKLLLMCGRDDAIMVYLDGKEAFRENLPAGPDAYEMTALKPQASDNDGLTYAFFLSGSIEPGEHILAISVHNATPPSSDLRIGGITLVETGEKK